MKSVLIISNNLECDELVGYFAKLEQYFILNGWQPVKNFQADLIIIAACGAIDVVHEYVKNALADIKKEKGNYNSTIIMGCQVVTHRSRLNEIYDGKMIGYEQEEQLDAIIDARYKFKDLDIPNVFNLPGEKPNQLFTIIISTGCLRRCTYCIIKSAHGFIQSKTIPEICKEYSVAVAKGFKNIALAGTDTSVYGYDINTDIITLIKELRKIDSTVSFYIENLHPHNLVDYYDDFIQLARENALAYLHIAFQHVDDEILKRMGRQTDFEKVYELIRELKKECARLLIYTDFIFGFPGETEQQFEKLLDFVKEDPYIDYYYIHDYCDIIGTTSYQFADKIDEKTKKDRGSRIMVAFERRKEEKFSKMDPEVYSIFKNRYDIENGLEGKSEKGYVICKDTYVDLEGDYAYILGSA